ncbi:MAG: L,D-transpeptidase family protein [Proteobacteria bacterium]|nr:L,D-transpeptidase family protein [Pseudomonadota bacterium]
MLILLSSLAQAADGCPASTEGLSDDKRLHGDAVVLVFKEARRLGLYADDALAGCWQVGLAYDYNAGHKQVRGDLRTPEGWYRTSDKPWSQFYGAIAVHYPGKADAERGLKAEVITQEQHDAIVAAIDAGKKPPQDTRLGGEILIHGGGGEVDWTLGCVALDNGDLDTLRAELPGTMRTDVLVLP